MPVPPLQGGADKRVDDVTAFTSGGLSWPKLLENDYIGGTPVGKQGILR